MTNSGVDGLSHALLSIASNNDQVALLHRLLDRYCHRFRNRLNSMKLCLYLGQKTSDEQRTSLSQWRELENRYQVLEHFVEQFQSFCRPFQVSPMEVSLNLFLEELRKTWNHRLADHQFQFELLPPGHPVQAYFDPSRMSQGLDALASWRGLVIPQGSLIHLSWWDRDNWVYLRWEEPEPLPIPAAKAPEELQANIALPILARILQAHGGTLQLSSQEWFQMTLRWPRFPSTP